MAAGAGAAAAAIAQAVRASGVIVRLEPTEFLKVAARAKELVVVTATGGVFNKNYQYLMAYKGLAFFTRSTAPLDLPASAEMITAKSIWVPG